MIRQTTSAYIAFGLACTAAYNLYLLGLPGGFIFDDHSNLQLLESHGGIHDLSAVAHYLDQSFAGPTGRPIAMLSFLLDARDWPADSAPFIQTNILLHIVNGLLLFLVLRLAIPQSRIAVTAGQATWIAAIGAAWWLLTPYHVSTVLYIVQRMAELATTFTLLGIIAYLLGRRHIYETPLRSHLILSLSVITATIAATLSKENGALLPALLLVLEFTLLSRATNNKPSRHWITLFLVLPSAALIAYLSFRGLTADGSTYNYRGFTQGQRLLTESRILLDYLQHLLVPATNTDGLFRDTIEISTSLLQPLSTLWSVLTIGGLIGAALLLRRHLPLLSTAILFFFTGHLLESTSLPLELAFEHRNYLPSLFLYLPVAQLIVWAYSRSGTSTILLGVLTFSLLGATLAARAELWSDRSTLYRVWAETNPNSPRAIISYANTLENSGEREKALAYIATASDKLPDKLLLKLDLLRLKAISKLEISDAEMSNTIKLAETGSFTHEAVLATVAITDDSIRGSSSIRPTDLLNLWQALLDNPNPAFHGFAAAQIHHQMGRLHLHNRQPEKALDHFNTALKISQKVETGLKQTAILASNGYFCSALAQLRASRTLLENTGNETRRQAYYLQEIERLTATIDKDRIQAGQSCRHAY